MFELLVVKFEAKDPKCTLDLVSKHSQRYHTRIRSVLQTDKPDEEEKENNSCELHHILMDLNMEIQAKM